MQLTGMMVANTVDLKLYLVDIFSIFQIQCFAAEIVKVKWLYDQRCKKTYLMFCFRPKLLRFLYVVSAHFHELQ